MESEEFSLIRQYLNKTQNELARLLCLSPKAIQSFEQGWRNIPTYVERQLLVLLSLEKSTDDAVSPCWERLDCPGEWRRNCIVWEHKVRHLCWFINGTYCNGQFQESWAEKIKLCRQCAVFISLMPSGLHPTDTTNASQGLPDRDLPA